MVAVSSEKLLEIMNNVTGLYEKLATSGVAKPEH